MVRVRVTRLRFKGKVKRARVGVGVRVTTVCVRVTTVCLPVLCTHGFRIGAPVRDAAMGFSMMRVHDCGYG